MTVVVCFAAVRGIVLGVVLSGLVAGCAYPRYETNLAPIPPGRLDPSQMPQDMYTFRLIGATMPERKVSGLSWDDDDGTPADPFVRLYLDNRLVWQSDVLEDTLHPEWNAVLPGNVIIKADSNFRMELLDWDTPVTFDPIARIERTGLPVNALPDAIARLQLDTRSTLTILLTTPTAHRGVGLSVELRSSALKVISVEPYSPASRAGVKPGQLIVGIGTERVANMTDDEAASALSLAAERKEKLVVTEEDAPLERDVELDEGFLWLVL